MGKGATREIEKASLNNLKILNIKLRNFYVMFKCKSNKYNQLPLNELIFFMNRILLTILHLRNQRLVV